MTADLVLKKLQTRRNFLRMGLGLMGAGALTGCASKIVQQAGEALRFNWSGMEDADVEAAAAEIPYASLAVRMGKGQRSLLVLGKIESVIDAAPRLHWFSADEVVFVTQYGRLIQSAGLPSNLIRAELMTPDSFPLRPRIDLPGGLFAQARWLLDIVPGPHFSEPLHAEYRAVAKENLQLWAGTVQTIRVHEKFTAPGLDWSGQNIYWVDSADARVWRAEQQLVPSGSRITWEVMRPLMRS